MYYHDQPQLNIVEISRQWSQEDGALPASRIQQKLLDAFWRGDLMNIADELKIEQEFDPDITLNVLVRCGAVPYYLIEIEDNEKPRPNQLIGIASQKFDDAGKKIIETISIPREVLKQWCVLNGIKLPHFWFASEASLSRKKPGRPGNMEFIFREMDARAERGELEKTVTRESRELHVWAKSNLPSDLKPPKPRSIENTIRLSYKELKGKN